MHLTFEEGTLLLRNYLKAAKPHQPSLGTRASTSFAHKPISTAKA